MEPAPFFAKLIQSIASIVEVSEATVFVIGEKPTDPPRLLLHVRPGNASKEQIGNSLKIFSEVVKNCAGRNQDLALMVNDPRQKDAPVKQFCLTHLVRRENTPRFAISFASRCRTPEEGTKKVGLMARLTMIWQDQLDFDAVLNLAPMPQTAEVSEIAPAAAEGTTTVGGEGADSPVGSEGAESAPASDAAESTNS